MHLFGDSSSHTDPITPQKCSISSPTISHGVLYVSETATANPYKIITGKKISIKIFKGQGALHIVYIAIANEPPTKHRKIQNMVKAKQQPKSMENTIIVSKVSIIRTGMLKIFQRQQPRPGESSQENRIPQQQSSRQQLPHSRQQQSPQPTQLFSQP